ncbi:class I SAM-dependent methyltransferase [candidate division KSB1 bacterium]
MQITLKKLLQLENYKYNILRLLNLHNYSLNKEAFPVEYQHLCELRNVKINKYFVENEKVLEFAQKFFPVLPPGWKDIRYKKMYEFYATYDLLKSGMEHVYLDVAGGIYSYIKKIECKRRILQDIRISREIKQYLGESIDFLQCNASNIALSAQSVDRISVHHSFEHFQQQADTGFITEVQRLLSHGGKCCIIPIFLAQEYVEVTDQTRINMKFDSASKKVVDITSILPGGPTSGSYARIYSLKAFQERVIDHIDHSKFAATLYELEMESTPIPDMSLPFHKSVAHIESPYRALLIERL